MIPTTIAPQQGCNSIVRKGMFTISPAGADVQPMYDWSVSIEVDCQPIPAGVIQGADDVGTWHFESTEISFSSMKKRGRYSAILQEASGSEPRISFSDLGNSYRFKRIMKPDDPRGTVFVKVTDQSGQPVGGVGLVFVFTNGLEGGGTTPASGEFGTSGIVGECIIRITLPTGYAFAPTQTNPVSVTVVDGPPVHLQVSLIRL